MCGIAGFVERRPETPHDVIAKQLALLEHRGPDALGWWPSGRAVIGQTRLSVIDLAHGDPPITTPDDAVATSLNGEIYNFAELRQRLAPRHTFRTNGDTEVVAHLFEELGPVEAARELDGMFAIAVWDERRQTLVLARDRLGKKPLYYWHDHDHLVFASEIRAVLVHPAVPRQLDESVLGPYLTFGYAPSPRTFFDGVRSLPPGHVLTVGPDMEPHVERYWQLDVPGRDDVGRLDVSMDEAATLVLAELRAAVQRRLVGDVRIGAHLSGGIDSSAVVAIASELADHRLPTFTVGFADPRYDERPVARSFAAQLGTEHHEYEAPPASVDLVERLVWHHDQPFGDSSAIPSWLLSELVVGEVKVALSGDGGDELFAGYERFAAALAVGRWQSVPGPLRRAVTSAAGLLPPDLARGRAGSVQRFLASADRGLPGAYVDWLSFADEGWRRALLGPDRAGDTTSFSDAWAATEGAATLDRLQLANLSTYLVDDLLPKADRMSMAHGLEVRSPFLDHHLAELALRLPPSTRARGLSLKRVLRHALRGVLPDEILHRRKKGFGVPLDRWFREDLEGYVEGMLGSPGARVRAHLAGPALDRILAEHRTHQAQHGQLLWALLTLEVFLQREGW